ncbi:FecR family protein [Steroidobacter sp.]|uniref:FecR family protein n=1 Tax=Steroidobacter sp. TaxID=1978227 RepID=UPI001A6042CE|nr:FecR domain-containing protein [Steroidobacter sp.]MBL8267676.1 FecR domain-containing protein [Steroidobacter sp.]
MEYSSDPEIDVLLSQQAAGWFVRLVANDLSLRERREYLAWLKASGRHVEALLDIYRYHGYGRKAKLNVRPASDAVPSGNVIPFALRGGVVPAREPEPRARPVARWRAAAALAGIVFCAVAGWTAKTIYFEQRVATEPGEWQSTMLADGSVLRIGPNTRLRWSFDDDRRSIVLSRGEAVFEVARDPSRPFIVTTRFGDVRALGTEFGVSLLNAATAVVTVAHGRVAVSKPNDTTLAELVEDQQMVMSAAGDQPIAQVDANRELQWATGYYEFRGETVRQAIEQFNRRNRLQVVMADPAIGAIAMPFTTVKLDDPETFVAMLAARPDVQVAYQSAEVIRLLPE